MTEDELIALLQERQNNGRTAYLTFGELVAMVPADQMDEWRAVLAKVRSADAARDARGGRRLSRVPYSPRVPQHFTTVFRVPLEQFPRGLRTERPPSSGQARAGQERRDCS